MITEADIARFNTIKAELLPLATAPDLDDVQRAKYTELSAEFDELVPKIEDHVAFEQKRTASVERMPRLNPVTRRQPAPTTAPTTDTSRRKLLTTP